MIRPVGTKRALMITLLAIAVEAAPGTLVAQDRTSLPPGWNARRVTVEGGRRPVGGLRADPIRPRELTIERKFVPPWATTLGDPLDLGSTRYGDVRSDNPFPTVTSGTQLPFGLDGIGGFGSDVGFTAGANAALYDRGG